MTSDIVKTHALAVVGDSDVPFDFTNVDFDQSHPATPTLILSTMCANVVVLGIEGFDRIQVAARGNKSTELNIKTSGPDTLITAPLDFLPHRAMNSFGGGNFTFSSSGVSVINGVLHVNGQPVDLSNPFMMLVLVPVGTRVKVGMVVGKKVVVRGVRGALEAKLAGTTNLDVDQINEGDIKVSGTGSFQCGTIFNDGKLSVEISGMGNAGIAGGRTIDFEASVSGMGSITFMGEAAAADLSVSGMGSITLMTCTQKLKKDKSGMGKITVINDHTKGPGGSAGFSNW